MLEAVLSVTGTIESTGLGNLIYKREDGTIEEEETGDFDFAGAISQCLPERLAKEFLSRIE